VPPRSVIFRTLRLSSSSVSRARARIRARTDIRQASGSETLPRGERSGGAATPRSFRKVVERVLAPVRARMRACAGARDARVGSSRRLPMRELSFVFRSLAAIIAGFARSRTLACQVRERKNRRDGFPEPPSPTRRSSLASYLTSHYYARPPHPLQLVIPFVRLNDELIPDAD